MERKKIAVQLYSVRKELAKDPDETFKALKEIGFEAVQLDGMRGHSPQEIKALVDRYGFEIAGMHLKHDRFFHDIDGIIEEALLFNCKTIYDKYIDDEDQHVDGYVKTKRQLLHVQEQLKGLGFRVGLHCPEYDFNNQIDGVTVLDYITAPAYGLGLYAEPDTYWMSVAGKDPVEEFKKFSYRAPIVHLKDYKKGYDPKDMDNNLTELGSGDVRVDEIVRWGEANGVEYYCIEQDYSKIGMLQSLAKSFDYLVSL
ncbi:MULTISPECIES: sugar phosphate isomerase/epimerase [unclassified Streptococcus]|uniref:sugar phosphate isomerase/epimerase family protein n=1 Tax=unclassified Streptococcus TaxID=2608887 RepID=UPI001072D781|nr:MULTISPECIES: sugar phosphate isomerase/epimerase [unclassified Streptococcus]MCQ9211765.1 sugar phosphate isomerase/epimerase [Streptococcus sp. B01]MCQ9213046.1 sugar phosphate isomerase/epimerase [Streptococcus sp. O1]TFV05631.1 sugar phosphate isomerase/epimerase [Streptococcus sp. LYSM12]